MRIVNHMNFARLVSFFSFLRGFLQNGILQVRENHYTTKESNTPCFPSLFHNFTGLADFSYCLVLQMFSWGITIRFTEVDLPGVQNMVLFVPLESERICKQALLEVLLFLLASAVCTKITLFLMKEKHSGERWSLCTMPDEISLLWELLRQINSKQPHKSLLLALCATLGKQTFTIS